MLLLCTSGTFLACSDSATAATATAEPVDSGSPEEAGETACDSTGTWKVVPSTITENLVGGWAGETGVLWTVGSSYSYYIDGVEKRQTVETFSGGAFGFGKSDVWLGSTDANHGMLHWTGASIAVSKVAGVAAKSRVNAVWGTQGQVFAAGLEGALGWVGRWNGTAWDRMTIPAASAVKERTGISGTSPSDVWVVGAKGSALHFDGAEWKATATDSQSDFKGVSSYSSDNVWAVGTNKETAHWASGGWKKVPTEIETLYGVYADAANCAWAVSDEGRVARFDGTSWKAFANPVAGTEKTLRAIFGTGPKNIFAVGDAGTILHYE